MGSAAMAPGEGEVRGTEATLARMWYCQYKPDKTGIWHRVIAAWTVTSAKQTRPTPTKPAFYAGFYFLASAI